jgi:radical SAM-linked protein
VRVRLRFSKIGKVRWTSHRDVARMWERAFRRTELQLAYTAGFSPRPKVSFGLALPTGSESVAEYIDIELDDESPQPEVSTLPGRLSPALPTGLDVLAAVALPPGAGSLQHEVTSCAWDIEVVGINAEDLDVLGRAALAADRLVVQRERKGKATDDDIRPAVLSLVVSPSGGGARVTAELATLERGVRPAELLAAIAPDAEPAGIRRTHQWIERDGAKWEPISLDATAAPHAQVRAS